MNKIERSLDYIEKKIGTKPELGIILGSGLGSFVEEIEDRQIISYEEIVDFPKSTVEGHKGQFVLGRVNGKNIIAMDGRFHFYEGYDIDDVVLPVRLMIKLGIDKLIVTNAAGGVNKDFKPGDLMIIKDHINFSGRNPLIGKNMEEFGPRFPDMSEAYSESGRQAIKKAADKLNLELKEGVYMYFTGPNYETPAEVRMARILGADAVGMSTVPEVIIANHASVDVLGISCITNMAAGILEEKLNHEEVIETSKRIRDDFSRLVYEVIGMI